MALSNEVSKNVAKAGKDVAKSTGKAVKSALGDLVTQLKNTKVYEEALNLLHRLPDEGMSQGKYFQSVQAVSNKFDKDVAEVNSDILNLAAPKAPTVTPTVEKPKVVKRTAEAPSAIKEPKTAPTATAEIKAPNKAEKRGGRQAGELESTYRKRLAAFQRLQDNPNTDPDKLFNEAESLKKAFGKDDNSLLKDLQDLSKSAEVVGAFQYTTAKHANQVRGKAVDMGMSKTNSDRLIIEEGKYENRALNEGTELGEPAKTRSYRVGVVLTPEEKKAMGTVRFASDELQGKIQEVNRGSNKFWVFGKTEEEALRDMNRVLSEIQQELVEAPKKVSKPVAKKEPVPIVSTSETGVTDAPKVRRGADAPSAKRTTTKTEKAPKAPVKNPDAPKVKSSTKSGKQIKEELIAKIEKRGGTTGHLTGKETTYPKERTRAKKTLKFKDKEAPNRFVPEYKKSGTGKKVALGAAAAAGAATASMMINKPKTEKEQSKKRLNQVVTGTAKSSSAPKMDAAAQAKADTVRTVKTKGGDYAVFKKDSVSAKAFRSAYASAKKSGNKVFTFNGLKYKVP